MRISTRILPEDSNTKQEIRKRNHAKKLSKEIKAKDTKASVPRKTVVNLSYKRWDGILSKGFIYAVTDNKVPVKDTNSSTEAAVNNQLRYWSISEEIKYRNRQREESKSQIRKSCIGVRIMNIIYKGRCFPFLPLNFLCGSPLVDSNIQN